MPPASDDYINALDAIEFDGRYVLKIDFPEPVSTRYFSESQPTGDIDAIPNILHIAVTSSDGKPSASIRMRDPDAFMLARSEVGELENAPATLYHAVDTLPSTEWLPIISGRIAPDTRFETVARTVTLTILPGPVNLRQTIGTLATRDPFDLLLPDDDGRMLPIVYGRATRVRSVGAKAGSHSTLARPLTPLDTSLWVTDPTGFPGTTLTLQVGDECIEGAFSGRKFIISQREAVIVSGATTHYTNNAFTIRDTASLSSKDEQYAGQFVHVTVDGVAQSRRILSSVGGDTKILRYSPPFIRSNGTVYTIPPGETYQIKTVAAHHPTGTPVRFTPPSGATYIVAGHAVTAVRSLYAETAGGDLTPIETSYWTANCNDSTSFPGLGFPVSTVTLTVPPSRIAAIHAVSDAIFADVDGPDDNGQLIDNPAAVIRHILRNHIGVPEQTIDSASFQTATDALAGVTFGFHISRPFDGWLSCRSLAMQALAILDFTGDAIRLTALPRNLSGDPVAKIGADTILPNGSTPLRLHGGTSRPVSVLSCEYGSGADAGRFIVKDAAAVERFGERARLFNLFAVPGESTARSIAAIWLERLAKANTAVHLVAHPKLAALAPGDIVSLQFDDTWPDGQRGEITSAVHLPRTDTEAERVALRIRLPVWEGCASTCEAACETGCESGCEASCETACESGCEDACESICQTTTEMGCFSACELSCTATCQAQCQAGCELGDQAGCAGACEASYETGCASGCVSSCESACIVFCESGCESLGESGCDTSAETACVNACESGCESDCETSGEDADGVTLSLKPEEPTQVTDGELTAAISDMFVIKTINGKDTLCLKDGLFVSDGVNAGALALKYDAASGTWGVDLAFYSDPNA